MEYLLDLVITCSALFIVNVLIVCFVLIASFTETSKPNRAPNSNIINNKKVDMLEKELRKLKKLRDSGKEKMFELRKKLNDKHFTVLCKNLSPTIINFLSSQIKCATVKTKGRRFNFDDKILGL